MKLITLITVMTVRKETVFYPVAEGDKLATCSVNGVALLARVQHEVSIAE